MSHLRTTIGALAAVSSAASLLRSERRQRRTPAPPPATLARPVLLQGPPATCNESVRLRPLVLEDLLDRPATIRRCDCFAGRYELGSLVMPCTSRGTQVRYGVRRADGEPVVIKVRSKREAFVRSEEEAAWRANTEELLALPPHDAVAGLWEVLEDAEAYYVVMERVDGQDLFETMCQEGLLPLDEVAVIVRQLLHAISHLHSHGLIYRDLKLDNVMLARHGKSLEVKLVDFDTVSSFSAEAAPCRDVLGTDQYIAPEAYEGRYSPASDVFALGALAYWLLAGRPPFEPEIFDDAAGENRAGSPKMQAVRSKLLAAAVPLREGRLARRPSAQRLLRAMLAAEPQRRPSPEEALARLSLAAEAPAPAAGGLQLWPGLLGGLWEVAEGGLA